MEQAGTERTGSGRIEAGQAAPPKVGMTELGKERNPKLADRIGIVYGPSRYPNTVRVLWDGNRSPNAYHRSYIRELAPGETPPAQPAPPQEASSERGWTPPRRR